MSLIWRPPKIDWELGDGVAASDLNRIEGNLALLMRNTYSANNSIFLNVANRHVLFGIITLRVLVNCKVYLRHAWFGTTEASDNSGMPLWGTPYVHVQRGIDVSMGYNNEYSGFGPYVWRASEPSGSGVFYDTLNGYSRDVLLYDPNEDPGESPYNTEILRIGYGVRTRTEVNTVAHVGIAVGVEYNTFDSESGGGLL